jgi:hypothetical protein
MRSLILSGLVSASIAFAGNGAAAATINAKSNTTRMPVAHTRVAAQYRYPAAPYGFDRPYGFDQPQANPMQIINSLLGSPLVAPYVAQYARRGVRVTRGSGGGSSESYDTPTASPPPDTSIQDMLNNQAQQQAIQQMNDISAMNASMAAAAEQNAEATAAMNQQIMNSNGP